MTDQRFHRDCSAIGLRLITTWLRMVGDCSESNRWPFARWSVTSKLKPTIFCSFLSLIFTISDWLTMLGDCSATGLWIVITTWLSMVGDYSASRWWSRGEKLVPDRRVEKIQYWTGSGCWQSAISCWFVTETSDRWQVAGGHHLAVTGA